MATDARTSGLGIHELFESQVRDHPRSIAVVHGHRLVSYAELNADANQLAHQLRVLGVGPETTVGIVGDRAPAMLVTLLAVLKSGGAYLPLDLSHPPEVVATMLADSGARLVVGGASTAALVPDGVRVLNLDTDKSLISVQPTDNPALLVHPHNLAYCVYTSGSTGKPKAVMVTRTGLVNHALYMTKALGIHPGDRFLQFTSLAIDAALEEILPAWLGGAAVVLASQQLLSVHDFTAKLDEYSISVVSLPSSYWHQWAEYLCEAAVARPRALRLVFVGGEKLRADILRRWYALGWSPDVEWLADYGPTEATISCMTSSGRPHDGWDTVPIGTPVSNMEAHLLDADLASVSRGATGEIYLEGIGLARGYLHRPELTAERFLPSPFGPPGARMYRTGDCGYLLPDGSTQFAGRVDDQLKIRGHRVEPGQVENALLRCTGVREAVVTGVEDEAGTRLVAYVMADEFSEAGLLAELGRLVPPTMVPGVIVPVDGFARCPVSGKLDRSRLPAPMRSQPRPAFSALEQTIATVIAELTGRAPNTTAEDFFATGGDSLRALQLIGRLTAITGVELTYADLIATPTIGGLAATVRERRQDPASCRVHTTLARTNRGDSGRRIASHAQKRLWVLHKLQGGVANYSVPFGYRIRGRLAVDRLDRALNGMASRHEVLRTALVEEDGTVWQYVASEVSIRTAVREAADLPTARRLATEEARRPFDLTAPPLLRSLMIGFGGDEYLWLLNIHHAVFDAWSLGVFWRELGALFQGEELPEPSHHYADFVDWQENWLHTAEAQEQRSFWRSELAGELPALRFYAQPADPAAGWVGSADPFRIGSTLYTSVREMAIKQGSTEFCVLLAAFLATLRRSTGGDRVVVGIPVAGRLTPEVEPIIGYLVNTLPLAMDFTADLRFDGLVAKTTRALSAALAHQELPFDEVVDAMGVARDSDDNPLFQAMFVMQGTPVDQLGIDGFDIVEESVHSGTAKVDLTCTLRPSGGGLAGEVEYRCSVLDGPATARWLNSFLELLSHAVHAPQTRVDELAVLAPAERQNWIARINDDHADIGELCPLHTAFESMARRQPEAPALISGHDTVSYGELAVAADRVARTVAGQHIGLESTVGVCLDRSADLVTALLGTLKAGAAFVPLDPGMPVERMRAIIQDAHLSVIVTDERHAAALAGLPSRLVRVADEPGPGGELAAVSLDNLAYVYYTSGSTGRPKGVLIDHRCAANRVDWISRRYRLGPGVRVLHKTPVIFDVALWEIFSTLGSGATVVLAAAGAEADVTHLRQVLGSGQVALAHFVPSMLGMYLNLATPADFPALRWVQVSGEAVPTELLRRFGAFFSVELHNVYGQTETSEVAAWEGRTFTGQEAVPMGGQIGIYRLFVLDEALNPLPPGMCGELYVAGVGGLARGYHGLPGLTAEKFLPNPYPLTPGERLYRTGDLAWRDERGVLHYAGRTDAQTKIRGVRVEPGEVAAVLNQHATVRSCVVLVRPDDNGANQLVAYVVGDEISIPDLAAHAARYLSSYLLPAVYVRLDALPLTPSGKVDRLRLPTPTARDRSALVGDTATESPLEAELARLWQDVLGLDHVGRTDNFFVVGGNSLKSLRVLHRINETYGVEIPLRQFFGAPSVHGLASSVEKALVALVTELSDDEVARRLAEQETRI